MDTVRDQQCSDFAANHQRGVTRVLCEDKNIV